MHIISKKCLVVFWTKHPNSKEPLEDWWKLVSKSKYKNLVEIKNHYTSADLVGEYVVFNIGGNKHRLITSIHFNRGKIYIREVLTHAEYSKKTWK